MARSRASRSSAVSRADEMRHVGDVHAQPPAAVVELLQRDRVVEIAGVDRIDRDDRLAGEVRAVADRFVERFGLPRGPRPARPPAKLVGEVELADDRKRVDARLSARAEHFGDHAFAVVKRRREADHLDDDFVVGLGVFRARIADADRLGEQRAVDLHVGRARPIRNTCRRTGAFAARRSRRFRRAGRDRRRGAS